MKKIIKPIVISLSASLFIFLSVFLLSTKDSTQNPVDKPEVLSMNGVVPLPDHIEFCGDPVDITRLDLRERMDNELNSLTYFHSYTLKLIKKANRFFPTIEPILKKNGIPDDFKYLATIESDLNVRALSPAKAAGLWQLMPDIGKKYGLEITDQVDERYHVEKSTEAACRYLREAYSRFGNWMDVAISYNAGMGRVSTEKNKQQANSALDLYLVEESSRYPFRILTIKQIFEHPYRYGFVLKKENLYSTIPAQLVNVTSDIEDLASYARQNDLTYAQLKDFNPWLRDRQLKVSPGKSYQLSIPNKKDLYFDKDRIRVHNPAWIHEE